MELTIGITGTLYECLLKFDDKDKKRTISNSIQNACEEPFCFSTYELGIFISCIFSATLKLFVRNGKNISPFFVPERYMGVSISFDLRTLVWYSNISTHPLHPGSYARCIRYVLNFQQKLNAYLSPWLSHKTGYYSILNTHTLRGVFEQDRVVCHPKGTSIRQGGL
jgi:hypothetical protein